MLDGSGSGKSASYVIPNACQLLGSYVFTDPKGELYDKTAGYLKQNGYKIKVLNLVNPAKSDGYNPLLHINNEIDVDVIANTIVKGQGENVKSSDPYWDDMAEMLLKALIYYLKAVRPPEEQNLASCAELVRAANTNGGDNLLTRLMEQLPLDHPARMNYKSIEIAPEKTAVFVISSDTHAAYDFLLTIFFSQMIQQLYDYADKCGGELPVPTYFILDEFANIGKIPDFDKKISTSRSRKISFSVILQNLDQLEAVYEKAYETIMGNCDTHLFLGSNSQKTVEYFSKALGEKTIFRESESVNKDRADWKQGKSVSDQNMARALLTADELRRMDNDECIIYEKGIKPIKANKYYYFKYKTVKEIAPFKVDHNDREDIDRGTWRKYNPYNPYVEEKKPEPTKIQQLDDLFSDEEKEPKTDSNNENTATENVTTGLENDFSMELPMDNIDTDFGIGSTGSKVVEETESIDIQKELEAKFDELFGSLNDANNE